MASESKDVCGVSVPQGGILNEKGTCEGAFGCVCRRLLSRETGRVCRASEVEPCRGNVRRVGVKERRVGGTESGGVVNGGDSDRQHALAAQ